MDNELPLGKRTIRYRFFEILPAATSLGVFATLIILSATRPLWAATFLLLIVAYMFIKAARLAVHVIFGLKRMRGAINVPWNQRLAELAQAQRDGLTPSMLTSSGSFRAKQHKENLARAAQSPQSMPPIESIYQAVVIPAYNEPYEVIRPTIMALLNSTFSNQRMIVMLAYEQRGGAAMRRCANLLELEFGDKFAAFEAVEHPANIPNEVPGKGGNITYAARRLEQLLIEHSIPTENVIVTSLDCDNRPHPVYFDMLTYEYAIHPDRERMSFQPVSIFTNNIWDAPPPSRLIASGNSLWNIVAIMRPKSIRNFASHAQPMRALIEMDFWSTRTIVEDGHQFWRSWFHYRGNYRVISLPVPIYQDVVLAGSFWRTIRAQFNQLQRWSYGASDVPYVAVRVFTRNRKVPFWNGVFKLFQLLESHVTLSCVALFIAIGPWIPVLLNLSNPTVPSFIYLLPFIVGVIQQVSMVMLVISVWVSISILPARPDYIPRFRKVMMVLQWLLLPITAIFINGMSAMFSQVRLAVANYREVFEVTEKSVVTAREIPTTTAAIPAPAGPINLSS